MEFGFIIILYVFVNMYVCIVYCMYCFDLKWNSHVDSINVSLIKKASKRLYFLRQLKRANVPAAEMIFFYCTCMHPTEIVEYASPVFHYGIPNYLSKDIERIQKSLKIQITNFAALLPDLNSNTAH